MTIKRAPLFVSIVASALLRYNVVAGRDCYDLLDIVHVQDVSSSFRPFLPDLATGAGSALTMMREDFPDVHFGFASFSDKNISVKNPGTNDTVTLDGAAGYCLRVDQPLQSPDELTMAKLFQELNNKPVKGEDSPTGVFEALYRAIIASSLRWRQEPGDGKTVGRHIVLVTGAPSRLKGDVSWLTGKTLRPFDITPDKIKEDGDNENWGCGEVEYPTVEQVAKLVEGLKDTHIVILVTPGGTFDSKDQFQLHQSLAGLSKDYHTHDGLVRWYTEQLKNAGLSVIRVGQLDNMSYYSYVIRDILNGRLEKTICPKQRSLDENELVK